MSKHDDEIMLAAYNEGIELVATLLKAMGCDGPEHATQDQMDVVMAALLSYVPETERAIVKQLKADHRKLTRLRAKQVS